jgi:hypothetical protein
MADRISRVRRRRRWRRALDALATAFVLVAALWILLPGVSERLRDALLAALLLLTGAGLIVFYWLDHRRRRWIKADADRRRRRGPSRGAAAQGSTEEDGEAEVSTRPSREEFMETLRFYVARDAPPMLVAATAEWIEAENYLRMSYFLEGAYEDADYGALHMADAEIGATFWSFMNFGTVFVFDHLLLAQALESENLVYRRA